NLPTDVLGISSKNSISSGIQNLANCGRRKSNKSSFFKESSIASCNTTHAIGRSCHSASGMPMTLASKTASCAMRAFSRSTDEIHSAPLLTNFGPVNNTNIPLFINGNDISCMEPAINKGIFTPVIMIIFVSDPITAEQQFAHFLIIPYYITITSDDFHLQAWYK